MENLPTPPSLSDHQKEATRLERTASRRRWIRIMGAGVVIITASFLGWRAVRRAGEPGRLKAMIPRQLSAGVDQFFIEFNDRVFINYRELVGPTGYIRSYHQVDGEDPSVQFPIRRDWGTNSLPVRLPDGSTVQRSEVFAAIGRSGLIATFPNPQELGYDPKRVYRLDCGVAFQGSRVVDLPPDPAGREGRDQDGVHIYQLPDGRRLDITYHGGVPDGPFRAVYADGSTWGEATYRQGRVIQARVITRKGRSFDELGDSAAATEALVADAKTTAKEFAQRGRQKLAANDHAGALAEFTLALNANPHSAENYLDRADARFASGDVDGAIADCTKAMPCAESAGERTRAELKLQEFSQRKPSR